MNGCGGGWDEMTVQRPDASTYLHGQGNGNIPRWDTKTLGNLAKRRQIDGEGGGSLRDDKYLYVQTAVAGCVTTICVESSTQKKAGEEATPNIMTEKTTAVQQQHTVD